MREIIGRNQEYLGEVVRYVGETGRVHAAAVIVVSPDENPTLEVFGLGVQVKVGCDESGEEFLSWHHRPLGVSFHGADPTANDAQLDLSLPLPTGEHLHRNELSVTQVCRVLSLLPTEHMFAAVHAMALGAKMVMPREYPETDDHVARPWIQLENVQADSFGALAALHWNQALSHDDQWMWQAG